MAVACFSLLSLLVGKDGLEDVTGLGNVGEINLGRDALGGAACRGTRGWTRSTVKVDANLLSLIFFQRTGVGLAGGQAELRQYVKNLPALDFHLACEIVDTNLTHPPLFESCTPSPLVAHSYLMALAGFLNPVE
jgi:hypothetical protein